MADELQEILDGIVIPTPEEEATPPTEEEVTPPVEEEDAMSELPDIGELPPAAPSAPAPPADNAVAAKMSDIEKTLNDLKAAQENKNVQADLEAQLATAEAEIRAKYGNVDGKLAEEFSDVLKLVNAQVAASLEIQQRKSDIVNQAEIKKLQAELAALKEEKPEVPPERSEAEEIQQYQSNLGTAIPFYNDMLAHPAFKKMLKMPVSQFNPDRTWDVELYELHSGRKTAGIQTFVNAFKKKYIDGAGEGKQLNVPTTPVSIDSNGNVPTRQGGGKKFDVKKAEAILNAHKRGETQISRDHLVKIREGLRQAYVNGSYSFGG